MNFKSLNDNVLCPICNSKAVFVKKLQSDYLKTSLSNHFNNEIGEEVEIIDYTIFKCNICYFEFAYPFVEGSNSFYKWVTSHSNYYPDTRWEYKRVLDLLENNEKQIKLLDVGCGDGRFLDCVKKNNKNIDYYGLDTTNESVEKCLLKGHKVYCMDIQTFKERFKDKLFDVITIFHVFEHIANPKEFLIELISLTTPGGSVYVSTPYSPMDFELEWFDVLNHPSHHMGRWNIKSYTELGEILKLDIEFFMPKRRRLVSSAINSFIFAIYGNSIKKSKKEIISNILLKPSKFISHLIKQLKREKVLGERAANVILVKFTKENN